MLVLLALLLLEIALVLSLLTLGWFGTGIAIQLVTCIFVTVLPLLVACVMLATNRLRFDLRSLLSAIALIAIFLTVSLIPLLEHRAARQASMRLLSANATISEGSDWDDFYPQFGWKPPQKLTTTDTARVPPWLTPFTNRTSAIPTDNSVRTIWLNTDNQCRILANHWQYFPALQFVGITGGVSGEGFSLLETTLSHFEHLDAVYTNDVVVPPNWYSCLTNIRTLLIWAEMATSGKPFPNDHLADIASLPNLEVFMVLGYAFNDNDARKLATSKSIKRVILRGTAVTVSGEKDLSDAEIDRVVYRN